MRSTVEFSSLRFPPHHTPKSRDNNSRTMPPSMRKQAFHHKKTKAKRKIEKQKNISFYEALKSNKTNKSILQLAQTYEIKKDIANNISNAHKNKNNDTIQKLLNPVSHPPGRKTVITSE